MKRTIISAIAALLLAACAELPTDVTVRFDIGGVQSGPMTKSAVGDAIAATQQYGTPTITLQSKTVASRRVTVTAGQDASVPIDTYTATVDYRPTELMTCIVGPVYATPSYAVDEEVKVIADKDRYTLTARFTCAAFVMNHADVSAYKVDDRTGWKTLGFDAASGYEVRYVKLTNPVESMAKTTLRATAVDADAREDAEYEIAWLGYTGEVTLEAGNWYLFPSRAVDMTSGTFGLSFGGFHEGFSGY